MQNKNKDKVNFGQYPNLRLVYDCQNWTIAVEGHKFPKGWTAPFDQLAVFSDQNSFVESGIEKHLSSDELDSIAWFWIDKESSSKPN
jgi:hypothetical protein